jgi:transcriptional antiterminator NusG
MAKAWYAIHTISGHENKVAELLRRRAEAAALWNWDIHDILIPVEQEMTTRAGKRMLIKKKVFPGYILVQMNLNDDVFKLIKSTSGVTGFVQSGNKPVPLEDRDVQRIQDNLAASEEAPKIAFAVNDTVRVIEGPFSDFTGRIQDVNSDREKITVQINMFGRDTPVELEFTQVEKV